MLLFIIYLIGCAIGFYIAFAEEHKRKTDEYCPDACAVYAFMTILSWIAVAIYAVGKAMYK